MSVGELTDMLLFPHLPSQVIGAMEEEDVMNMLVEIHGEKNVKRMVKQMDRDLSPSAMEVVAAMESSLSDLPVEELRQRALDSGMFDERLWDIEDAKEKEVLTVFLLYQNAHDAM
jgi:hypothetical protein